MMVDKIAAEMRIPRTFLAKILQKLVKGGVVKSFRGAKGGFQLDRTPEKITLLDVIEAVECPVGMNVCSIDNKNCALSVKCVIHPAWISVRSEVEEILKKRTFADFLKN